MKNRVGLALQGYVYVARWRITHLRCTLFGCKWGEEQNYYEVGVLYESAVECVRCERWENTYHVYGGRTELGRVLEAKKEKESSDVSLGCL